MTSESMVGHIPDCKGKKEILDEHNKYRSKEGASNMKKMVRA